MNERILHLAASHFPRDGDGNISVTPEMIMEFAELLVRACADAADEAQAADCKYAGDFVAEHMGFGEQGGVAAWRAK
jgi:hypothetical protein